jgi:hypothetical protein
MENTMSKNESSYSYFPLVIAVSSVSLYLTSLYSYLFFHFLIELFTIVIALGIFAIAWSSRRYVSNNFLLILGMSFFFIGSLDLIHTIAYKGMGIFNRQDANLPTQLWIAARYLESLSFLGALFFKKKVEKPHKAQNNKKPILIFAFFALIFSLILLSIFYWKIFPTAYVENVGLTPFKIISEYVIIFIFFFSALLLAKRRKLLDPEMANLLFFSLVLKMASEFSFTEYVGVYDFSNALGHLLKFMSFLLLYKAVLEIGLMKPYRFLFLDLKKSQDEYRETQRELQRRIEDHLIEAYEQLGTANRKISLLLEIGEQADQKSNQKEIIEYIMNAASSACHAKMALLYRYEENGNLSLVTSRGFKKEDLGQYRTVVKDKVPFIRKMAEEKKRINLPCRLADVGAFKICHKLNYFVAVPFILANKFKGFMFLGFERRKSMDSHELEFLDIFSIHATAAFAQMKVITAES